MAQLLVALRRSLGSITVTPATNDVVTDARKVLGLSAADENVGVLLEIIFLSTNVCVDFLPGGESDTSDDALSTVRLLGVHGPDSDDDTHSTWRATKSGRLRLAVLRLARILEKLIDCGHLIYFR